MLARVHRFLTSFKGALIMCILGLVNLSMSLSMGSSMWPLDVAFILMFAYFARRALKGGVDVGCNQPLSADQKARIKAATERLYDVMKSVDDELVAAAKQVTEEADDVQSDQRKDQEAGSEGTDRRTDSKEDR